MEERLLAMVREDLLEVEEGFGVDDNLFDAGLDSMGIMQLLVLVEEEFGVEIPAGEVSRENFTNVRALVELVERRKGAAGTT